LLGNKTRELIPGLIVTFSIAVLSFITWWILKGTWLKFSALLWAFIFSLIAVNIKPSLFENRFKAGIDFSSSRLLRWSIAALGLTVSASVWIQLGGIGLAMVLINLAVVFTLGLLFCKCVLKMDDTLTILVAVGTAICGASAIAAVGPALRAKAEQVGLALAAITLFGLIAMFGYPLLFNGILSGWLGNSPLAYGMWVGTGIHETAQVIAAASQVDGALSIATSAKFIRIFMIGPMVLVSLFIFIRFSKAEQKEKIKLAIPWFAVFFVAFTLVNYGIASLPIGDKWASFNTKYLSLAITFLLAWSFAGIGLKVKFSNIKSLGFKAFLGGVAVAVIAGVSSLLLVKFFWMPLSGHL
jgi:uncharacterized integral membrane protein (TIGR00698 family)